MNLSSIAGDRPSSKTTSRHFLAAARIVMGLLFVVMGLNGFLNFLPRPSTPMPAAAVAFLGALIKAGYMLPLLASTQLIVGALLLSNRFVALALGLIAPVVVNILLFHAFLAPTGFAIAVAVTLLEAYLAWAHRGAYRPMLAMHVAPTSP